MKKYVLAYTADGEYRYYHSSNLYLSSANLTDDLQNAYLLTLDDAVATLNRMSVKDDWKIWSTKTGVALDEEYTGYKLLDKKRQLEEELEKINNKIKSLVDTKEE